MAEDLAAFLSHRPVSARRVSPISRLFRRVGRSRAAQGAVCAVVIGAMILTGRQLHSDRLQQRGASFNEAWASIPASLCIVNGGNRRFVDAAAAQAVTDRLDAVIETRHEPALGYTMRAAFRLDQGDVQGAVDDMRQVASISGTPFAVALAARYRDLSAETPTAFDLDLEGLPDLQTTDDYFLRGFHALRANDLAGATANLKGEGLEAHRYSRELSLFLDTVPINRAVRAQDWDRVYQLGKGLVEDSLALESEHGGRSAATAHLISFGFGRMARFSDALKAAKDGIALSSSTHVTFENASRCARALDRFDDAAAYAKAGIALAPSHLPLREHLIYARISDRRFDEARELLSAMTQGATDEDLSKRAELAGTVEVMASLDALLSGNVQRAEALADLALEKLSGANPKAYLVVQFKTLAVALRTGKRDQACVVLIDYQLEDPYERDVVERIFQLLPEERSKALTQKFDELARFLHDRIDSHRFISSSEYR